MSNKDISVESWNHLINAAEKFRLSAPWKWMKRENPIGIEDPETGEIGFCVIPKHMKSSDSLAVYRGKDGLASYDIFLADDEWIVDDDFINQNCFMLAFLTRSEMDPADKKMYKEFGLMTPDRKKFPVFRKFDPGFIPILPENEEEMRFFALVIEQLLEVEPSETLKNPVPGKISNPYYFVRKAEKKDSGLEWYSDWMQMYEDEDDSDSLTDETEEFFVSDDDIPVFNDNDGPDSVINISDISKASEIKKLIKKNEGVWFFDTFYLPFPVADEKNPGGRPYYPDILILSDRHSELILDNKVVERSELTESALNLFYDTVKNLACLPENIVVRRGILFDTLYSICNALDVMLIFDHEDDFFEEIRSELINMFKQAHRM